jgi:Tfp pilus assembly protein PilN
MNSQINERELMQRIAALPREIAPEHDVWPAVLSRIERRGSETVAPSRASGWRYLSVAAGLLVAFAAGLVLGPKLLDQPAAPLQEPGIALTESQGGLVSPGLSATLAATEMEYQAAFREFMSVDGSNGMLSPVTVDTLLMTWNEMRESEELLTVALQENPDSPFLKTRMMELRSRQLHFLKQVAALDHNSRRTNI